MKRLSKHTMRRHMSTQLNSKLVISCSSHRRLRKMATSYALSGAARDVSRESFSEHVYDVQDLLTEKHSLIHANRLKFYVDSQLDVTEDLRDTIDHNNPVYNTVSKLLDLRYNASSGKYEVQTKMARGSPTKSRHGSHLKTSAKIYRTCYKTSWTSIMTEMLYRKQKRHDCRYSKRGLLYTHTHTKSRHPKVGCLLLPPHVIAL